MSQPEEWSPSIGAADAAEIVGSCEMLAHMKKHKKKYAKIKKAIRHAQADMLELTLDNLSAAGQDAAAVSLLISRLRGPSTDSLDNIADVGLIRAALKRCLLESTRRTGKFANRSHSSALRAAIVLNNHRLLPYSGSAFALVMYLVTQANLTTGNIPEITEQVLFPTDMQVLAMAISRRMERRYLDILKKHFPTIPR